MTAPCPRCGSRQAEAWEDPDVYDGVLYWVCEECGKVWGRWFTDPDLRAASMAAVEAHRRGEVVP